MNVEDYRHQQREKGEPEWARLIARARAGDHPTREELLHAVLEYGVDPASDARFYVAELLARAPRPRGGKISRRRPRKVETDPSWVRWFYLVELEQLQLQRKADPRAYRATHKASAPSAVALARTAARFNGAAATVSRIIRSTKFPAKWWGDA